VDDLARIVSSEAPGRVAIETAAQLGVVDAPAAPRVLHSVIEACREVLDRDPSDRHAAETVGHQNTICAWQSRDGGECIRVPLSLLSDKFGYSGAKVEGARSAHRMNYTSGSFIVGDDYAASGLLYR
jgi:hypothetical protein